MLSRNQRCNGCADDDPDAELVQKHQVLQQVIVSDVYTGGSPSIVEECGFGSGEKGYAHLQCVMTEFESDPLIAQYVQAAMMRVWEAGKFFFRVANIRQLIFDYSS